MNEKRLVRSQDNRMVAGVAAGIAEYLDTDPTLIRLLFVIMTLAGGPGLLAYFILWLVMPEGPAVSAKMQ
ncbi:MAG: PspC domain-containing protein [Anaerolineales bacterium]|nr:PspC domain-containing protein [Anaerolineales bacterium]